MKQALARMDVFGSARIVALLFAHLFVLLRDCFRCLCYLYDCYFALREDLGSRRGLTKG